MIPSPSQKAVSRGISGPLKVSGIGGERILTERARSIASGELQEEKSE